MNDAWQAQSNTKDIMECVYQWDRPFCQSQMCRCIWKKERKKEGRGWRIWGFKYPQMPVASWVTQKVMRDVEEWIAREIHLHFDSPAICVREPASRLHKKVKWSQLASSRRFIDKMIHSMPAWRRKGIILLSPQAMNTDMFQIWDSLPQPLRESIKKEWQIASLEPILGGGLLVTESDLIKGNDNPPSGVDSDYRQYFVLDPWEH